MKYTTLVVGALFLVNAVAYGQANPQADASLLKILGLRHSAQLAETDYQELIRDFLLRISERTVWDAANQTFVPMGWKWNAARQRYEPAGNWNAAKQRYEVGARWNTVRQRYEIGDQWDAVNQTYVPISWKWNTAKQRFESGTRWNAVTQEWE